MHVQCRCIYSGTKKRLDTVTEIPIALYYRKRVYDFSPPTFYPLYLLQEIRGVKSRETIENYCKLTKDYVAVTYNLYPFAHVSVFCLLYQ